MTDNNYKKILYIEDNEYQRKLIIQRFEKKTKGFKITGVSTIKEAKELMSKKNFDLILTDYLLKGEEGFDIFDLNVDIPVILITAYGNEETAVKALKLGAYDYLIKDNQERFIQNLPHIINKAIEKYKSNKEAELNKERLRKFMDSATDSFILMDSGFKILEINKTALKYIGKSKNEVIGKDIAYINLLTEANELRNKYINVIKTGKPFTIEHTYTHKYFGESTFNIKAFKVGEGIGLIITDTTPSQKTQKQLLEERNRANQYLKVAGVMILALNKDAEVIMINPKGCEIIGYSEEEILNKNWIEYCIPNKDKEKVKLVFNRFCKGEIDEDIEKNENRILTKSGEERILSFNNTILYDDKDNIIGILSSGEDITEQKKIEEALKESEEKYRNIVETANEGILILDKNYNIRFLNDKLTNMFGYSDEEMLNTSIFDYIPEEYKKLIKEQLKDKMKGVKGTHDIKFIKKDNSELWAIVSTSPIYNPNKEYIGFIKMLTDITQRKKNEEKLKLLSKVFQKSNDGIVITDPNAHIIEVNKSFTEITGYSQEEAKEKNINILKSGKHNKEFYHDMWYQVTTIGHWQGEIWDRKKDGEIYPKWLSISSIKDDNGRIKYFISIFSDISVIKEAEEKLRRLAHYDMLTELPNRIFFLDRLQNAIQRARRYKKMLAVMFIDLDGFKNINDTLGHRAGDKLLVEVAKRLKNIIRGSDTVARLGGDEFIILMLDIT
ncbi:MAG: PAS domain S-box protein, partial [Spirochaetota bacterium]